MAWRGSDEDSGALEETSHKKATRKCVLPGRVSFGVCEGESGFGDFLGGGFFAEEDGHHDGDKQAHAG